MIDLPEALELLDRRLPGLFRIHMASGALALALVPIALATGGRFAIHRPVARAAALCVLVAGATSLPSALMSAAPLAVRMGLLAQGLVWLALLGVGFAAIRRAERVRHRRVMLMLAAVTSGAVVLRLLLFAASYATIDFDLAYGFAAWFAWLGPLAIAFTATRAQRGIARAARPVALTGARLTR
ncbi:DUF2306 domain-containing protein [Terrarubrum flagellatum]|uniref:DUF2306 domain-containing protein n=1 Tax=Terrirubrum flagellatum TaxID=2895980 RepID=UPI00314525ED